MKKLLNTLYITKDLAYLSLDGENIVISAPDEQDCRLPLCNLEEIICFNYKGCSPQLMGKCAEENISLTFLTQTGRLLARVIGKTKGNVFTRIAQIDMFRNPEIKISLIQNCLASKFINTKFLLSRSLRDYNEINFDNKISDLISKITNSINLIFDINDIDVLRGIEGEIAKNYFSVFDRLIRNKNFEFKGRSKRPPLDEINSVLSFLYTLQANSIASALESTGIDPYIGFFHTERPGRVSLALDILEEFRASIDRFVISMFNLRQLNEKDFIKKVGGAVLLNDDGRFKVIKLWQEKKKEKLKHPILKQKMQFGILPFIQASLLGKFLRKEIMEYTPYYNC